MQFLRMPTLLGAVAALAMAGASSMAAAQSFDAEAYFKGKTIDFIITSNAGGGQDTLSRLLLTDFSDFVPGNPTFVPTNVSDLAGISAVTDAPASDDRITIGITTRASTLYLSAEDPAATHDPSKIRLAAGFGTTPSWTMIFNDAAQAYTTLADASGSKSPEFVFAETVGDPNGVIASVLYVSWLCDTFDLPCRMVNVADANTNTLAQDVQRGDLNMMDANSVTGMRLFAEDFTAGKAKIMVEYGEEGSATLDTPYARPNLKDLFPSDEAAKEFEAMLPLIGYAGVANVIFAGPNVPPEAVHAIGEAFMKKMSDPAEFAEVAKGRFGQFTPTLFGPDQAQAIYDSNVKTFSENEELYKTLQQKLYDKYWK